MRISKFLLFIALLAITSFVFSSCTKEDSKKGSSVNKPDTDLSTRSGEIGQIVDGLPQFTGNSTSILANWNSDLSDLNTNLTSLAISQNAKGAYILVASGAEYRSTRLLQLNGSILNFSGTKTTCTTKSCAHTSGCEVTIDGRCSACTVDCTKSTSDAF